MACIGCHNYNICTEIMKIGIDPDITKSGVATMEKNGKVTLYALLFFKLIDFLAQNKSEIECIFIEASHLISHNWTANSVYRNTKGSTEMKLNAALKTAQRTGENHKVGKLITEWCNANNIVFQEIIPKRGNKVTPEIFKAISGISTKNQEKIDAAMLLYRDYDPFLEVNVKNI